MCLTDEDQPPRLFVTNGSQIGVLHPSLFPGVGFGGLIESVSTQVDSRWINLWRPSDVVNGQVIEPLGSHNWQVQTGHGHSRYELTPEFCAARVLGLDGETGRPSDSEMADCW